ncbi:dephospho-CoA kinase [Pengzhenrongella frigida]|uniref:Dephospho-CoA kinase n=1 Tax=Pengzhenrongella frigida TaxID=1259133 RepID=A0A4Q5N3J2_9MICO|nr:dephospho-CoA kinase [Cellulomonas sp. HLT2-17]RYV52760.1 dephospho-CoA kinase [Cellulomonas sp. HLT2-17]
MQRIGLTGGIAAGKSVVAGRLAELGAVVIDADRLAREAVRPGSVGLDQVVEAFGPEILASDGSLDREALGHVVFADPAALARLNAIVHPIVRRLAAEREAAAGAADAGAVVVHDIPLLIETGQAQAFHLLVVVHTPAELRVRRLMTERGLTEQEARSRIAAQVDDETRVASADVVLDGTRTVADLQAQVDQLWERLQQERVAEVDAAP